MGARRLRHEFERYAPSVSVHIVPPPCPQSQSSYDYSATAHLIARARESTRRWIDDHGLERCEFPEPLSIHSH
jgi:NTE family protein